MKSIKLIQIGLLAVTLCAGSILAQSKGDMDKLTSTAGSEGMGLKVGVTIGNHVNPFGMASKAAEIKDIDLTWQNAGKVAGGTATGSNDSSFGLIGLNGGVFAQYTLPFAPFIFARAGFNYTLAVAGKSREVSFTDTSSRKFKQTDDISSSLISMPLIFGPQFTKGKSTIYMGAGLAFTTASLTFSRTISGDSGASLANGAVTATDPSYLSTGSVGSATQAQNGELKLTGNGIGFQFLLGWAYEITNNISLGFEWAYQANRIQMKGDVSNDTATKQVGLDVATMAAFMLNGKTNDGPATTGQRYVQAPVELGGSIFQIAVHYGL